MKRFHRANLLCAALLSGAASAGQDAMPDEEGPVRHSLPTLSVTFEFHPLIKDRKGELGEDPSHWNNDLEVLRKMRLENIGPFEKLLGEELQSLATQLTFFEEPPRAPQQPSSDEPSVEREHYSLSIVLLRNQPPEERSRNNPLRLRFELHGPEPLPVINWRTAMIQSRKSPQGAATGPSLDESGWTYTHVTKLREKVLPDPPPTKMRPLNEFITGDGASEWEKIKNLHTQDLNLRTEILNAVENVLASDSFVEDCLAYVPVARDVSVSYFNDCTFDVPNEGKWDWLKMGGELRLFDQRGDESPDVWYHACLVIEPVKESEPVGLRGQRTEHPVFGDDGHYTFEPFPFDPSTLLQDEDQSPQAEEEQSTCSEPGEREEVAATTIEAITLYAPAPEFSRKPPIGQDPPASRVSD